MLVLLRKRTSFMVLGVATAAAVLRPSLDLKMVRETEAQRTPVFRQSACFEHSLFFFKVNAPAT